MKWHKLSAGGTERLRRTSAKIKRGTPLYEQIYDALWNLIFDGEISAGQRLSDREWALRLSTSRTPVREAMRQMARDGILVALENGGYQVRNATLKALPNCIDAALRSPLWPHARRHALPEMIGCSNR